MAKVSDLEGRFNVVTDKLTTIGTEIKALKDALSNTDIPDAAEAALERLETAAQVDVDAGAPSAPTPSPGVPQPPTT